MTCRRIQHLIQEYVDGAADRPRREAVEGHVARCAECASVLEHSRRLVHLLASVPGRRTGPDFDEHLRSAIRHTPPRSLSAAWWERFELRFEWRLRVPAMVTAGSLAAGLLAAVVTPQLLDRPSEDAIYTVSRSVQGQVLSAAVERHRQLERANADVNWDAVNGSIALSTGSILTE